MYKCTMLLESEAAVEILLFSIADSVTKNIADVAVWRMCDRKNIPALQKIDVMNYLY